MSEQKFFSFFSKERELTSKANLLVYSSTRQLRACRRRAKLVAVNIIMCRKLKIHKESQRDILVKVLREKLHALRM